MNLTKSIEPNSAQVNAEDLLSGARTVTITGVEGGSKEQPVFIHLEEFPNRTYRPSLTMRRVLVVAWGEESAAYIGQRLTLFRNPDIKFGKDVVGGIQISHLSGIAGPLNLSLTSTRGKRSPITVQPLTAPPKPKDESGRDWLKELTATESDMDLISALGAAARTANASNQIIAVIRTEYQRVKDEVTK
jgi:hypothetical protein